MAEKLNTTILLTGATGGIGRILTLELAQKGYDLALQYHNNLTTKQILEKELNKLPIKFKFYQADLAQPEQIQKMMDNIYQDFSKIDVVVNNAGVASNTMSWKINTDEWHKNIAINLTAPFLIIQRVLPQMRANNFGRIINISSVVAQTGVIGTAPYAASKAGLFGLTKTIAKETANKNITVNCLALGYFEAGMLNELPQHFKETVLTQIPKQQFGNPQTIAHYLHFLISQESNYITGQIININGGLV